MTGRYEFLEHTADIGIRAEGETLEEAFEAAAGGLLELLGAGFPGEGEDRTVEVRADDREALLVSWLDELLYLHESEDLVFGGIRVERVGETRVEATVRAAARGSRRLEGIGVKAATYHRLRLHRGRGGWTATVYLDV